VNTCLRWGATQASLHFTSLHAGLEKPAPTEDADGKLHIEHSKKKFKV